MANEINVGDRQHITAIGITDQAGNVVDPPTLKLLVRSPDLVLTTYTYGVGTVIVRLALGSFEAYIPLTMAGTWSFDWYALDAQAVGLYSEGARFYVAPMKTG